MKVDLRPARADDARALADLQVAAWRAAFTELLPPEVEVPDPARLVAMSQLALEEQGVERTVALVSEGIAGFCTHGPSRDDDAGPEVGEIRAIFVHPGHWRRGAGAALVSNGLQSLRNADHAEVTLWSFGDNHRANAFYERQGFTRDGATQQREAFGGTLEVRYRRLL